MSSDLMSGGRGGGPGGASGASGSVAGGRGTGEAGPWWAPGGAAGGEATRDPWATGPMVGAGAGPATAGAGTGISTGGASSTTAWPQGGDQTWPQGGDETWPRSGEPAWVPGGGDPAGPGRGNGGWGEGPGPQPGKAVAPRRAGRLVALVAAAGLAAGALGGAGAAVLLDRQAGVGTLSGASVSTGAAPTTMDAKAVAAAVLPSVVQIQAQVSQGQSTGSGFVIDRQGHILTNAHVVGDASQVTVVTNDGRRLAGTVVGADAAHDVAVVQVQGGDLSPLVLGRSSAVAVGDPVLAVGSPLGLSGTVTQGIISAKDRGVEVGNGEKLKALQTDAPINPGNSGGPLVDSAGRVIGMNSAIATLGGSSPGGESGSIGIGFAIPIDRAVQVAQRILGR